jgi:hypothetical protein
MDSKTSRESKATGAPLVSLQQEELIAKLASEKHEIRNKIQKLMVCVLLPTVIPDTQWLLTCSACIKK